MNNKGRLFLLLGVIGLFILSKVSCGKSDASHTGYEYMPDMAHSLAYEANVENYYGLNTWSDEEEYMKFAAPRKPVKGTVPRGQAGYLGRQGEAKDAVAATLMGTPTNGYVPYYYGNTEEERILAMADPKVSRANYMPTITKAEMDQGKELYDIFCGICHGEKGDGNGYLVSEDNKNAKYPAAPSNYLNEEFLAATDGRFYHAVMHGKNVMGSYKDKVSFKERWQIIHHIRSLQHAATDETKSPYPFLMVEASLEEGANVTSFSTDAIQEVLTNGVSDASEAPALILDNVLFETGSANLKTSSRVELNELAKVLTTNGGIKIQINGHTDNVGDTGNNKALSEERAKAVYNYLATKGIEEGRLSYKGFGDTRPIATNDTDGGKKRNRRTDFIILKD
jgi:outer membrane protein OmpA-like peptidoglycan-associated protein